MFNEALVWDIARDCESGGAWLEFHRGTDGLSLHCQKLIIAVGAYDRPVPFPGWTLPGVYTAGGAQRLVKTQKVLPGEHILLVGTGPLQLALANQIAEAGGRVEAIVEAGKIEHWPALARGAIGQWALLADAWRYWRGLRRHGIPLWRRHIIVEARGNGQVEEAVVAEVDQDWRPRPGTHHKLAVDTVCVGYGFVPSVELTRLAECEHRYEPLVGGWIPVSGDYMETSVPGIYAVGDCAGIAGNLVALDEGRIAGLDVARALGRLTPEAARQRMARPIQRLARLQRLRKVLDQISMPRPGLYELARDDTLVCRCEEVTLAEVRKSLVDCAADMNEVKYRTRIGMGKCQGRMCIPALQEMVAREMGLPPSAVGGLSYRPPVKPVPLAKLAGHK